jgi:predicted phosphodiesterase
MRILIISDIHANITALEAVLADAKDYSAVWCLGDLVGYGPDPNPCIVRVRELPNLVCVIGNHDSAALKQIDVNTFNPEARSALLWTRKELTRSSTGFLNQLPERITNGQVTLAHGSPRFPVWEYLLDTRTATQNFPYFDTPLCFVGHTHLPVIYSMENTSALAQLGVPETNQELNLPNRAIVNPGSVGQPRDRDPRAAYAIYDAEKNTWDFHRIAYDVPAVQARMTSLGLPERHIVRLSAGW